MDCSCACAGVITCSIENPYCSKILKVQINVKHVKKIWNVTMLSASTAKTSINKHKNDAKLILTSTFMRTSKWRCDSKFLCNNFSLRSSLSNFALFVFFPIFDNCDHSQNMLHMSFESKNNFLTLIKVFIQINFVSLVCIFNARFSFRSRRFVQKAANILKHLRNLKST